MKHKAKGGAVYYTGAGSNVEKEAEEKKHGGRVHKGEKAHGEKPKHRMDKRARGGRTNSTSSPFAPGSARHPFSSAAK